MTKFDIDRKDNLKNFISESGFKMPFEDFEEKVMNSIKYEASEKHLIQSLIIKSWIFFALGLILGIFAPNIIGLIQLPAQLNENTVSFILQVTLVIFCLFFLEKLITFTIRKGR